MNILALFIHPSPSTWCYALQILNRYYEKARGFLTIQTSLDLELGEYNLKKEAIILF
jgi:hypothetical protein